MPQSKRRFVLLFNDVVGFWLVCYEFDLSSVRIRDGWRHVGTFNSKRAAEEHARSDPLDPAGIGTSLTWANVCLGIYQVA